MKKFSLPLMIACVFLLLASNANAQSTPVVSIITFQAGTVYWQRFGHNAILVRHNGKQTVYNYGVFDFAQKNFMLNFAQGKMKYQLVAEPLARALYPYHVEGRWALEQQLALSPEEAEAIAEYLVWNAKPENADYRYDYFLHNCSTKVRDVLDEAMNGALKTELKTQPATFNYREQIARVSAPAPILLLAMDLMLSSAGNQRISVWEESFIPDVLMEGLRSTHRADGSPLVVNERYLLQARLPAAPTQPPTLWPLFAAIGLFLAIGLVVLGKLRKHAVARITLGSIAGLIMLLCGIGGLAFVFAWAFTAHWAMHANQNVLLLSPLCLLLLPAWLSSIRREWKPSTLAKTLGVIVALSAVVAALLQLIPSIAQTNGHWIALFLPLHWALAYTLLNSKQHMAKA